MEEGAGVEEGKGDDDDEEDINGFVFAAALATVAAEDACELFSGFGHSTRGMVLLLLPSPLS